MQNNHDARSNTSDTNSFGFTRVQCVAILAFAASSAAGAGVGTYYAALQTPYLTGVMKFLIDAIAVTTGCVAGGTVGGCAVKAGEFFRDKVREKYGMPSESRPLIVGNPTQPAMGESIMGESVQPCPA